ncbi:MAG: hypothetical protein GX085_07185 [Firmicutes bacterium]|nr:hypothetical protein [Bacillota bacterium]
MVSRKLLSEETGVPIHLIEDPLSCVVPGAGKVPEHHNRV